MAKKNVEFDNGIETEATDVPKVKTTFGQKVDNLMAKACGFWQKHKGKVIALAATAGGVALYQNFKTRKSPVDVPEVDLSAEGVALMGAADQVDVPFNEDPLAVTTE